MSKAARNDGMNYSQAGTPFFAAPEVWKQRPYDFKADIWSIGCIAYYMACQKMPFQVKNMDELYKAVM